MLHEVRTRVATMAIILAVASSGPSASAAVDHSASELVGTWRGTSTCTDRVAAPACNDEVVIYDFSVGAKPGSVLWKADKVVDGQRQPMGELDLAYDTGRQCWIADFQSPRSPDVHTIWCLVVDGAHLTGTGQLLPGKQMIRRIDVRRVPAKP